MSGFDVRELLRFAPPRGRCPRCLALFTDETWPTTQGTRFDCPVCAIGFLPGVTALGSGYIGSFLYDSPPLIASNWGSSLRSNSLPFLPLTLPEPLIEHAQRLGRIVTELENPEREHSPIRLLTHLLLSARAFVHVMTTGLSQDMLGVLRTVAEVVPIYGIFGRIDKNEVAELEAMREDGVPIAYFVVGSRSSPEDFPHTKLIVVDGLVAVSGSANLTTGAWRKAAKKMERVEAVTNSVDVVRSNNEFFASQWARLNSSFHATGSGGWRYDLGPEVVTSTQE